ncbi:MAG: CotH kinase family protein [Ignavibacteriales bacterium]|nr:CotH kinase family protein [Ignavibacteriales bacterium]
MRTHFSRPLLLKFFQVFFLLLFFAPDIHSQSLYINEFMASNVTAVPEIIDFDDYSDWIEIYNDSTSAINISGYYLTDNLNDPTKWQIPDNTVINAKSYFVFWADGNDNYPNNNSITYYHTNFNLSKDGEEIGLFSPDGELIDSVIFDVQISDISFGRNGDGDSNWVFFGEPTFNNTNNTNGTTTTEFSNIPQISLDAGFYNGLQNVTITSNPANALITYTTDGNRPLSSSPVYSAPIEISKNTTLRIRVFEEGKLPSKIITRSYFIDQDQNLPVLSITAFPETFFDKKIGIYTNEIKSREVPISAQYFTEDGNLVFEVDAGIRLTGQWSFNYPQKPLTIELDEKYGYNFINYQIFKDRPFTKYTSIYLRNSGTDDNIHTHFRDAFQHSLVINQMDVDCQAFQPAATFINGEYWGIYNLREKLDNNYFAAHHDVNPDNLDYLEYEFSPQPNIVEGDTEDYFALLDFMSSNSMNIEANWQYIKSKIDVNEVMNYLITEIYCDNVNWPETNSKWWKEKTPEGKWRYIFLDSDFGFGAPSYYSHFSHNMIEDLYYGKPAFSSFVFRKLLENKEFKNSFIQRFALYQEKLFSKDRVLNIFDSIKTMLNDEMIKHIDRWNNESPNIPNVAAWNYETNIMREFGEERPQYMKEHLASFFNLSGTEKINFSCNDSLMGSVFVEDVQIENNFEAEFYRYTPIKIEAVPKIGYRFVKWIGVQDSLSKSTTYTPTRTDSTIYISAIFEEDNVSIISSNIIENTTLNISGSPYFAKGNVIVNPNVSLTVDAGVEILMPENANLIIKGDIQFNGTEEQPITIKANENSGFNKWGYIFIDSATAKSNIKYVNLLQATQNKYDSSQIGAISSYKSDLLIENVTILDAPFPIFVQFGNVVIRNCKLHTEEVSDLINIKYAESALTENCDLRGNNQFDTDAIDYDNISSGIIRNNRIYNFYGFNSDGIDLGEGAKEILVEGNLILNCNDKGISVGQGSTAIVKHNIIVNCAQGLGIKDDSSYAYIDRNTFYNCDYGVASFEKNIGAGGGNAEIVNSIFSKSVLAPVFVDNLSQLKVDYSLSDNDELEGIGNIKANPQLSNNFILTQNSPAVNTGNPATELDPDGTRADIGAKYFDANYQPIVINEINYNSPIDETLEFIELYNTMTEPIDISGYKIKGVIDFTFPNGTIIGGKDFVVIAKDIPTCCDSTMPKFAWGEPSLPNDWGNLILQNNLDEELDFVSYSNKFEWPVLADGKGYSLELRNPLDENLATVNWQASSQMYGSPGQPNRLNVEGLLFINELQADNKSTVKDENAEYDDWIEIYNGSDFPINIGGLYLTDDFDDLTKHQIVRTEDESNIIIGDGHYLFWADGTPDQGINHTNFKLDKAGEQLALVYIFEKDTLIIDSVSFGNQETDFSYARKGDGEALWEIDSTPSPNEPNSRNNVLDKGILLVNGLRMNIAEVINSYENKAFWGEYKISFWDLFTTPSNGYPESLPEPKGNGIIPLDTLIGYSTVIWLGDNSPTDVNYWNTASLIKYVKMGGNFLLILKNGREYLNEEFLDRLGINWIEPENAEIRNCVPTYEGLDTVSTILTHFGAGIFDTVFTNQNSKLLFTETDSYSKPVGIGVWNKPEFGGWYKENGGNIIFLSGRPFLYNNQSLKNNVTYMLHEFLNETDIIDDIENEEQIITEYKLSQNYPNPFNPSTTIKYSIPNNTVMLNLFQHLNNSEIPNQVRDDNANVKLIVYDILGREVTTLVNQKQKPGNYEVEFNARNLTSGIYFYRITAGTFNEVKKMILLK